MIDNIPNLINDNVNYNDYTTEELEEILAVYKNESKRYFNYEQSVKLMLNSIYGAFGNEFFYFFDIDFAESITLQGQNAILYTENKINEYFIKMWHVDTLVHEKLGIKVTGKCTKPAVVYIDTDSCYVSFQEMLEKSDWVGTEKDFILKVYNIRLKKYIEKVLQMYADNLNAENFLIFELETVAKSGIFLAKKNYLQDIVWKDPDIHYDSLSKVKVKGFDTVKSSTPPFAREKLKELLLFIFSKDYTKMSDIVPLLKKIKKEFKLSNIESISHTLRIGEYSKYIKDDIHEFNPEKGCPMHVRGAGYHNYLLNNSNYKNKYRLLKSGEKVKTYYSLDKKCDVFTYAPGDYPIEFAPKIDYDAQFEKSILDPMNRILTTLHLQELDRNLIYAAGLF